MVSAKSHDKPSGASEKLTYIRDRRPQQPVARSKRRSGPRARVRYRHLHHEHHPPDRDNDFQLWPGKRPRKEGTERKKESLDRSRPRPEIMRTETRPEVMTNMNFRL